MNHIVSISESHAEEALRHNAEHQLNQMLIKDAQAELQKYFLHEHITIDTVSMEHQHDGSYIFTGTVLLSGDGGVALGPGQKHNYKSMKIFNTDYFNIKITSNALARESVTHDIMNKIFSKGCKSIEKFFEDNNNAEKIGKLDIIFGNFKNYMKKFYIDKMRTLNG
jgi:hypothetical protein